jgi:hypothetical protein
MALRSGRMHTLTRSLLAVAALLPAIAANGQSKPDFSGTWSQVEPQIAPGNRYVLRIELQGSSLKIKDDIKTSNLMGAFSSNDEHVYTIGAPTETKKGDDQRVRSLTVSWDGPAIVFVRTTLEGANVTTERTAWTLSDDGSTLTRSRETTDWQGTTRSRSVLQRQ